MEVNRNNKKRTPLRNAMVQAMKKIRTQDQKRAYISKRRKKEKEDAEEKECVKSILLIGNTVAQVWSFMSQEAKAHCSAWKGSEPRSKRKEDPRI